MNNDEERAFDLGSEFALAALEKMGKANPVMAIGLVVGFAAMVLDGLEEAFGSAISEESRSVIVSMLIELRPEGGQKS